jgi:hypothetical protein
MKQERIDDKARVWIVTRGSDGKLHETLDPDYLALLSRRQLQREIAETRVW